MGGCTFLYKVRRCSLHGAAPDACLGLGSLDHCLTVTLGSSPGLWLQLSAGEGVNPKSPPTASQQSGAPLPLAARLNVIKKANTFLLLA